MEVQQQGIKHEIRVTGQNAKNLYLNERKMFARRQASPHAHLYSDEDISNLIAKNDPSKTAESYSQIVERTKAALQQIVDETTQAGGGNALVVSHGSEIATILELLVPGQRFLRLPFSQLTGRIMEMN